MKSGLCRICGSIAKNTCRLCGKAACDVHYDAETRLCVICKKGKE